MQILFVVLVFGFASAAFSATDPTAGVSAPQVQSEVQTAADDEADDWIFDSAPYTDNPKTGERVSQYAPIKPVYTNTPRYYSFMPRYYSSDPFFLPNTDFMFFQNTPDPFYDEPTGYPSDVGPYAPSGNFYGLETGGDMPTLGF
jgi:hypothetical protein